MATSFCMPRKAGSTVSVSSIRGKWAVEAAGQEWRAGARVWGAVCRLAVDPREAPDPPQEDHPEAAKAVEFLAEAAPLGVERHLPERRARKSRRTKPWVFLIIRPKSDGASPTLSPTNRWAMMGFCRGTASPARADFRAPTESTASWSMATAGRKSRAT